MVLTQVVGILLQILVRIIKLLLENNMSLKNLKEHLEILNGQSQVSSRRF